MIEAILGKQFLLKMDKKDSTESFQSDEGNNEQKGISMISNLFSQIMQEDEGKAIKPEYLRMKNNILIILLCLTAFFIYQLFSDFKDTLVLAFLSGVAFQQCRQKFINYWLYRSAGSNDLKLGTRVLQSIALSILFFILPWIRYNIGHEVDLGQRLKLSQFYLSFVSTKNITIRMSQLVILIYICLINIGPLIRPLLVIRKATSIKKKVLKFNFTIITVLFLIVLVILIPMTLTRQLINIGETVIEYAERELDCEIISQGNSTKASCGEKIAFNNSKVQSMLSTIKPDGVENLTECLGYVKSIEAYIDVLHQYSDLEICQAYSVAVKLSPYLFQSSDIMSSSKELFLTLFENIFSLLYSLSNTFFAITTFLAIFLLTVSFFNHKQNSMLSLFDGEKKQLVGQTVNLVQATALITVEHFFLSICLLELFHFSRFNLLLSITLSLIAFVPIVRPIFFVAILTAIKFYYLRTPSCLIFAILYWLLSSRIFQKHYQQIQFNQVVTNLSVLFGIYQFGVSGIIYGPLLIMAFQCVHRQLLSTKKYEDVQPNSPNRSRLTKN